MTAKKGGEGWARASRPRWIPTDAAKVRKKNTWPNGETVKGATAHHRTAYDKTCTALDVRSWKVSNKERVSDNGPVR